MISKLAVQQFLNRELDDNSFIKECSKGEILTNLQSFDNLPTLKNEPYLHQLASIYLGLCYDNYLFFLDMGLGKTFCSLYIIQKRKNDEDLKSCLVIVPNVTNIEGWCEEIQKHTTLSYTSLEGSKAERFSKLQNDSDVFVINYAGLQSMMTELKDVVVKQKKKKKKVISEELVESFIKKFNMVIYDEIHKCSDHESLTYKLCTFLSKECSFRYGLTGTPIGRNAEHFWPIFKLIDHGETLGSSISMYRQAFFNQKKDFWGGYSYELIPKMEPTLHRMLNNRSIRYSDEECQDLPPLVEINVKIKMTEDSLIFYKNLIKEARDKSGMDATERDNYYTKMRQICSGFLYFKNSSDEKETITFSDNEKLEKLLEIIEDSPKNSKIVVFHFYNKTSELISEFLKKNKVKHVCMNGSVKNPTDSYKKFKTDDSIKVLLVNIISGGTGLNLQNANYMIFYEPIDRPREYRQAKKRTHRDGQTKRVFCYNFITTNSIEERILSFLEEGKSLHDSLVEGKIDIFKQLGE